MSRAWPSYINLQTHQPIFQIHHVHFEFTILITRHFFFLLQCIFKSVQGMRMGNRSQGNYISSYFLPYVSCCLLSYLFVHESTTSQKRHHFFFTFLSPIFLSCTPHLHPYLYSHSLSFSLSITHSVRIHLFIFIFSPSDFRASDNCVQVRHRYISIQSYKSVYI